MATWSDIQTHVRSRYRLQVDSAQHFILAWQLDGSDKAPGSEPLVQGVHCQVLTVADRTFLLIKAEVCSDRVMNPLAALHHSSRLVLGALVLSGNHYVLRCTLPMRAIEADDYTDLHYALEYLAREAAGTRQRLAPHGQTGGTRGSTGPWSDS